MTTMKNAFEQAKQYTSKSTNFGNMDPIKRRQLASMGGKAAQESGNVYKWNSETARQAALKSWEVRRAKKAGTYQS